MTVTCRAASESRASRITAIAVSNDISPASCSVSMPVICTTLAFVRRQFFSLLLFPKIASLSHGNSILLAADCFAMRSASCDSVRSAVSNDCAASSGKNGDPDGASVDIAGPFRIHRGRGWNGSIHSRPLALKSGNTVPLSSIVHFAASPIVKVRVSKLASAGRPAMGRAGS